MDTDSRPEIFLIRFEGGPFAGDRFTDSNLATWPLDERFDFKGGYYKKSAESQLPPQKPSSPLVRGATYEWVTAGDA